MVVETVDVAGIDVGTGIVDDEVVIGVLIAGTELKAAL